MSKGREFDHSKYSLWIDPNEVIPYERNAKIHDERQIANIANSIRRFGWQQDTVITRDKVCVIGHGRRLAAIQLGCEMPYHVIDKDADEVTEDDIRELRLADNLTNSETGYNNGVLFLEIEDLDFDGFDFDYQNALDIEQMDEKEREEKPEVEFAEELMLSHNYIVLYFDNDFDWEVAQDKFGLKQVKDLIPRKSQATGIGRVIDGKRILAWKEN